ncbi:MAG: beta-galactosidase [Alphaproteobacteria bacterium]|nr:beta-galactosidase [Alphaproteobacteria bacterium]
MLGVCYYPEHWPESWWAEDARRMKAMGIGFVRIGEFAWSRMEPQAGVFDWGWLDRALDVLHAAGLKVVLCTPTTAPPKWLVDAHPDILPVGPDGMVRGFGSRRHYTFSSATYLLESRRITEAIALRYGKHPGVAGWQTDNEYGCHDTVMSYGPEDLREFRQWLRRQYQSPDQLNEAWGNVFWSMEVQSFDQVSLPNLTVTEANPAAQLDFRRFQSSQVAAYDKMQVDILRAHSPGRFITHNMMGFFTEYDHWPLGEHLDFPSWDAYPVGFTERLPFSEEEHVRWAETAHPDISPFNHDLYRAIGKGRFWVMEQQPGPVNWAPWNPVPKPGMVRLWTWEALAHGAEVVSYFRWRQAPFAQEQMHAGLNLPGLHELSPGGKEARQVGEELARLGALPKSGQGDVALVYDYEAQWVLDIQPQGKDFRHGELCFRFYEALRRLGLDVDIVRPGASLKGYKLVVAPSLPIVSEAAERAFAAAEGVLMFGPRSGSKTRHYQIPGNLPPGPLQKQLGLRVIEVSSLRPGLSSKVTGAISGTATRWAEHLETGAKVLGKFADGKPAVVQNGQCFYLACWPDEKLLQGLIGRAAKAAKLKTLALPPHIRLRRRGDWVFAFNYGPKAWPLPKGAKPLLGSKTLKAQELAIWKAGPG